MKPLRLIPLAWGLAAFVGLAALSTGPGLSRDEAGVLAAATPAGASAAPARPPLPALLSRAAQEGSGRLGVPHLVGHRLPAVLAAALLAALVAMLAGELAGAAAAILAPALLLAAPRLLLPLLQAGSRVVGAASILAGLLAYRRATTATHRPARLAGALACGALFGLALAVQLESAWLLAAVAAHAALLPGLVALRPTEEPAPAATGFLPPRTPPEPPLPWHEDPPYHARSSLLALAAMAVLGPAIAIACWPWLWTDTLRHAGAALAAVPGDAPLLHMGRLVEAGHLPWGQPVAVTALALPAALAGTFAAGVLHTSWRLARAVRGGAGLSDQLLLLLAVLGPLAAAQLGFSARSAGPAPWLACFPILAVLGARAIVSAAAVAWPARARLVTACLAAAALVPAANASLHAYPLLGSAWGELAGGAPGAASLGLPRHDGEAVGSLLREVSARARPGARVHWGSISPAALAVYVADGRIRPDLVAVQSPAEAEVALVAVSGGGRQEEFAVWAAMQTSAPVAGVFLDEVPQAWVYARPGAWR